MECRFIGKRNQDNRITREAKQWIVWNVVLPEDVESKVSGKISNGECYSVSEKKENYRCGLFVEERD